MAISIEKMEKNLPKWPHANYSKHIKKGLYSPKHAFSHMQVYTWECLTRRFYCSAFFLKFSTENGENIMLNMLNDVTYRNNFSISLFF